MKKIIYTLMFILFFFVFNNIHANNSQNDQSNIKKIELVEKYVIEHNKKINLFIDKYKIEENRVLNKNLEELEKILIILKKLKSNNIDKTKSEEVLKKILIKIRDINLDLKTILKKNRDQFNENINKTKQYYGKLGIKLSKQLDTINIKIAKNIFKDKTYLNKKETNIKKYLISLNKESKKLKNFGKIHFNSEKEIKESFIRILKNIKRNIKGIKNNI